MTFVSSNLQIKNQSACWWLKHVWKPQVQIEALSVGQSQKLSLT